jgi:hypothetical protein
MNPNMRRLTLASVGIRRMPDKPVKRAPALGRQGRAVKHDQVIFGQLEVERGAMLKHRLGLWDPRFRPAAGDRGMHAPSAAEVQSICRVEKMKFTG